MNGSRIQQRLRDDSERKRQRPRGLARSNRLERKRTDDAGDESWAQRRRHRQQLVPRHRPSDRQRQRYCNWSDDSEHLRPNDLKKLWGAGRKSAI